MTWPVSANEDGARAVVLGGADMKAITSSWQLNARSPVEEKGEGGGLPPVYVYSHKV